ncbi:MAG: alkyl hydroperoxide reductase [Ignavibacteria bacterium GWA2_55_11]|nr:MAG: alkyl hydroperoxide reductase [Ignavibacteria bacterium GWA2_55_11]OGU43855.1 MAG: alkyl hydroperoxide reductase [Ignavibacteria bacterium GWC2_56_12]OGU71946.1 MAG: alkyl hydroperoxide reductase [Ignavibacteria bacterium RIFCSPLOWO2_02_FULL_55_14]OGU73140.1 MAG: alkyl hydroperoxide reductase [Ignavibacteria bacterium RIFCSPLOWO2_12_FULL_56_21]HAV23464.1 peroxiredoxin [Bacteroidota bacterium]
MSVQVGHHAPDFSLVDTDKKPRTLKEFLGLKTVLVFFPGAFTGVCTKEMCAIRDSMTRLNELNAHVIGISVDSPFANKAFAAQNNLQFPILSDLHREVITKYGIIQENFAGLAGYRTAKRSVFVLDMNGVVQYAWITDNPGVEPNYEEVTKAVGSFK